MPRSPWMRRWSIDQRRPSTAERSHDVVSSRSRACSSACALRVDDCGRHFSDHAGDRGRSGRSRRADPAAAKGIRVAERRNLLGDRHPLSAIRADGAVRRRVDQSIRHAADRALGAPAHRRRTVAVARDDASVAAGVVVGRGHRARHGTDRARLGRHRCDAMVLDATRSRDRPSDRELSDRSAPVLAARRQRIRTTRLAPRRGDGLRLALTAFAVLAFMRDRPADVGQQPFGQAAGDDAANVAATIPAPITPWHALREASRTGVFWVLFGTFFICGASTNGLIQTHFIPLCADFGLPPVGAASVLAAMGMFDIVGTIGSGWLSDRYDTRWLLFWYYGLRGLSLMYLPFSDFTFYGLSLFALFYGLDWIATVPPTVKLTVTRFGRERANLVFGWIFAGHQL